MNERERPPGLFASPFVFSQDIAAAAPRVETAFEVVEDALRLWFPVTNVPQGFNSAEHLASTLACNDLSDLCFDLLAGRGRSAARTMRSLFEHLLTILEVAGDKSEGARFLAHSTVVAEKWASVPFEIGALTGTAQQKEKQRLRKLARDTANARATAIATYGEGFRLGWTSKSVKARAQHHGLAADYEVYRLTSAVLHGSSGGAVGSVRARGPHGYPVHRLGVALQLCPLAYLRGLTYFRMAVERLSLLWPSTQARADAMLAALDGALAVWPEYRQAILNLDEQWWATTRPISSLLTVLTLNRSGFSSWWLWSLDAQEVVPAVTPTGPDARSAAVRCAERGSELLPMFWRQRDYATFVVGHVIVVPKPAAVWQPQANLVYDGRPDATCDAQNVAWVGKDEYAQPRMLAAFEPEGASAAERAAAARDHISARPLHRRP